ncbi:ferritin heavy chain-like [Phacochoerus africanus]|uniref:ferritin heavy chain-like n=1 Tax=Phacochoerus africanus TaxID=41426 RepID=UPI001FD949E1|nr:ferritin heavy chain-like [Phacochoerus africanus]
MPVTALEADGLPDGLWNQALRLQRMGEGRAEGTMCRTPPPGPEPTGPRPSPSPALGTLRGGRRRRRPRRCPPRSPRFRAAFRAAFPFALAPPPPGLVITPPSQVRQNFHPECEAALNCHANLELHASYAYLVMAFSFDHEDGAAKPLARCFLRRSHERSECAQELMSLQNRRGGRLRFRNIRKPDLEASGGGLQALQCALHLEKRVHQSLLDLHRLATRKSDAQLCHFLKSRYLDQQVEFIKELGDHVTTLSQMGAPEVEMAEYLFEKLTLGDRRKKD